jgi:hypothetical protein
VRTEIEQADDRELADWGIQFLAWSLLDPRAAVARLEQLPISKDLTRVYSTRVVVADMLGFPSEERWRQIWSPFTEMSSMLYRDIP